MEVVGCNLQEELVAVEVEAAVAPVDYRSEQVGRVAAAEGAQKQAGLAEGLAAVGQEAGKEAVGYSPQEGLVVGEEEATEAR
eukprot:1195776-Pleurochrysis_carterae.AAC.2